MTEHEAMVELIIQAKREDPETGSFTEFLADFLLRHGVVLSRQIGNEPQGEKMPKFYFTYRKTNGLPFDGGWTEIEAPTVDVALSAFRAFHPDKCKGIMECSDTYLQEMFESSEMYRDGILGHRCREIIRISVNREEVHR